MNCFTNIFWKAIVVIFIYCISVPLWSMSCSKISIDKIGSDITTDSLLIEFLNEWRKDTTDCIKYRNAPMAEYIDSNLLLVGKTRDEVLTLLGSPNKIKTQRTYLGLLKEEDDFIYLMYFFEGDCQSVNSHGREDQCWIEVLISPKTDKAVASNIACN